LGRDLGILLAPVVSITAATAILTAVVTAVGVWVSVRTLRHSRSAHAAERVRAAVTDLTSPRLSVRISALHELDAIGRESRRRSSGIRSVIVAFLVERSRVGTLNSLTPGELQLVSRILGRRARRHWIVRSLAPVLRMPLHPPTKARRGLDLSGLNLSGTDFSHSRFGSDDVLRPAVPFHRSNLIQARFDCSMLVWCNFWRANLRRASLAGACLRSATFRGACLRGADLSDADLRDASLHGADLRGTLLFGANLATARGLTRTQIRKAVCDRHTVLPASTPAYRPSFTVAVRSLLVSVRRARSVTAARRSDG
jgi:hypothetical protein